jgi:hypothetical protein
MDLELSLEDGVKEIEDRVGHPGDRWDTLKARTQHENIKLFSKVQDEFLDLIWCLDCYRIGGLPPRGMGKPGHTPAKRLAGVYRSKGNWFAELISLLLINQSDSPLAPRVNVEGFSQLHQIDVAWPVRGKVIRDPLICAETKMTGAPAFGDTPARNAMSDWSNRRKELKFAATDLKLYRRQQLTKIDHWDNWRKKQPPLTYFLWCARMSPKDKLERMIDEVRAVTDTYLDAAGLFAYCENASKSGYVQVPVPQKARVQQLDDVLHAIANQIADLSDDDGNAPGPEVPETQVVDPLKLGGDSQDGGTDN